MTVKYVSDFSFPQSPPRPTVSAGNRPTIAGYAKGGHVKASTPQCFSKGGATTPFRYKDGGLHKHTGVTNDSGHTGTNGVDKFGKPQGDGPVKYFKKGGAANGGKTDVKKTSGVSNDSGHTSKAGPDNVARAGAGDKGLKYQKLSDHKAPKGTRTEKKDSGGKTDGGVGSGTVVKKAKGGSIIKLTGPAGKVPQSKNSVNPDDASSPGSYDKKVPAQSAKNESAAKFKSSTNTAPEDTGTGNKQRMAGWSDFKNGGRIKNLGHYAHGGKVKASGEKPSGKAGSGTVKAPVKKTAPVKGDVAGQTGSRVEMKSGTARASMGGLSRGTSHAKNAAIHAKSNKAKSGALQQVAQALSQAPHQAAAPGMGPTPPGMAQGMGAPPGGAMGPRVAPPMAGGPMQAGMSHGGAVKHVVVHHVSHGRR